MPIDAPDPLPPGDSAQDHFARTLGPVTAGAIPLRTALVRLRPPADDPDALAAARHALAGAVSRGQVFLAAGDDDGDGLPDGAEDDDAFLVAWPAGDGLPAALHDAVEVLLRGPRLARLAEVTAPPVPQPQHPKADPTPIVAVIDDGIGFLNARFRRAAADHPGGTRTRFHAVWLQSFAVTAARQIGRVLTAPEIDAMLAAGDRLEEDAVYRTLNRSLFPANPHGVTHRATDRAQGHGTAILDLAAGATPGHGDPVEDMPLLAVQLAPEAVDNTAGTQLEPLLVQGVRWCLRQARQISETAPIVINISFATFAGPKDGSKAVEALIARAVDRWSARTGREARVVLAFGNARRSRQAARLVLDPGATQTIDWRLPPDDFTASYLELRAGPGQDLSALALTLTPRGGPAQTVTPLPPDTHRAITDAAGRSIGRAYHLGPRVTAPGITSPPHLVLAMAPTAEDGPGGVAPHGACTLVIGTSVPLTLRAEVQRDDTVPGYRLNGRQSWLDHPLAEGWDAETASYGAPEPACPITRAGTHSGFATAPSPRVLTVGAARADTGQPMRYSAAGAPWTRPGPDLAAPSDRGAATPGLLAAGMATGSIVSVDGTSAAAAMTTRALARHLGTGAAIAPGPAEVAALIAASGTPADPALAHRLGAGVLRLDALAPALHVG